MSYNMVQCPCLSWYSGWLLYSTLLLPSCAGAAACAGLNPLLASPHAAHVSGERTANPNSLMCFYFQLLPSAAAADRAAAAAVAARATPTAGGGASSSSAKGSVNPSMLMNNSRPPSTIAPAGVSPLLDLLAWTWCTDGVAWEQPPPSSVVGIVQKLEGHGPPCCRNSYARLLKSAT